MNDLNLKVTKTISAPIEKVFDAWLDPEMLARFILPMPGMPEPVVENEAKEGGRFSILMQVGENKIPHSGTYIEINRPEKLVFSWESPFSIDGSTVTLDFKRVEEQITEVILTHVRFPDEESRSDHEGGWGNILEKLMEITSQ